MKPNTPNYPNRNRGSVLVVALVLSAIGTLGVLATVSIIGARSNEAESHFKGLDRRIVLNNSKALGREVMYRNYLPSDTTVASETTFTYSTWANIKVGAFSKAALSFADAARTHPTGAAPLRSFSQDVSVKLNDGISDHDFQYQLRSYNPALAGDLLSFHPTTQVATEKPRVSGDLKVNGRAVFWGGGANYYYQTNPSTVRSEVAIVPVDDPPNLVLEKPDGTAIKPSNYVGFNQTMGTINGGNTYNGHLDIVNNSSTGVNSYFTRLASLGGEVIIDGSVGNTDGLGPAQVTPRANDATLITAIQDTTQTDAATVGLLAANAPLSSNVMKALIARTPGISDSFLIPLLNSQAPLPDDVMIALADPTQPVAESTRKSLLKNTGFSYICDGDGNLIVNIESIYLPNLLISNASSLILEGQYDATASDAAELLQPRAIAIDNSDNVFLSKVEMNGLTNQRRMALAISQTGVLDGADLLDGAGNASALGTNQTRFSFTSTSPFIEWKMITETEGVSSLWDITAVSTATLTGGIRTDHSIRVTGGTLTLAKEDDPTFIESLVSRNAWIETYR